MCNKEEENVDLVLERRRTGVLEPRAMKLLLPILARVPRVELDGIPVTVKEERVGLTLYVTDSPTGDVHLQLKQSEKAQDVWSNGACLLEDGTIHALGDERLSQEELDRYSGKGCLIPEVRFRSLVTEILPRLGNRISIVNQSTRLPRPASAYSSN